MKIAKILVVSYVSKMFLLWPVVACAPGLVWELVPKEFVEICLDLRCEIKSKFVSKFEWKYK